MTQPTIKAVIFDMDGLMLDTERIAQQMWQQTGRENGFEIDDELYLGAIGRTAKDTSMIFREKFGEDFPFESMYERKQALLHEAITNDAIPVKTGLYELLDLLEERKIPKAVATSTARKTAVVKLSKTALIDRFPVIVCGDEVENGKPAPDIFLKAAAGLGIVPAHCLVLEDSESGIKAAHAGGMIPVNVPDMKQPSDEVRQIAYRVIDSLYDVRSLLD